MKECNINEFLTVKLEDNKPVIYIKKEQYKMRSFKYMDISIDEVKSSYNVDSIDDALEKIDEKEKEERRLVKRRSFIPEYWYEKLCSNLNPWAKNNYDTRLIYGEHAFQLLHKLEISGDPIAQKVIKGELMKRLKSGCLHLIDFLLYKKFYNKDTFFDLYLDSDCIKQIFINSNPNLKNALFKSKNIEVVNSILVKLDEIGDPDAREMIEKEKIRRLKLGEPSSFWFLIDNGYFKNISEGEINKIFEDFNYEPVLNAGIEEAVRLLEELKFRGVIHAKEILRQYSVEKLKSIDEAEEMINWLIYEDCIDVIDKEDLKSLDLKELTIRIVGSGYGRLKVPKEIGYIKSLESLKVYSEYDFEILPDSIGNLVNLKILDLSHNEKLEALPDSLINLKKLKSLSLCLETLPEVPEIVGKLTWLQELHLDYSYKTKNIPNLLKNLKNLKSLSFMATIGLIFPDWLGELIWVEELSLRWNNIEKVPEWVKNLKNLRKLNICENKISILPDWIGDLTKLEELNLNTNRIVKISSSIENLKKLQILDLSFNEIEELPDRIGNLSSLKKLHLDFNRLLTIPSSIGNLHNLCELDLRKNKLLFIPDLKSKLKNLKFIRLEENQLDKIKSLKSLSIKQNIINALKESNLDEIIFLFNNRLFHFLDIKDFEDIWNDYKLYSVDMFTEAVKKLQKREFERFVFPENYSKLIKQIIIELLKKSEKRQIESLVWLKLYHYLEKEDLFKLSEDLMIKFIRNFYYTIFHSEIFENPWDLVEAFMIKIGMSISHPVQKLIRTFIESQDYNEIVNIKVYGWLALLTVEDLFELLADQQLDLLKQIFTSIRLKGYEYHGFGNRIDKFIFNFFQKTLPIPEAQALKDLQALIYEQLIIDYGYHDEMFNAYKVKNNHVVRLWLGYSNISYLPESIGNLVYLNALDLTHCNLTSLPDTIGNLNLLERLDLFDNKLTSLPESTNNLKSLKFLDIGGNHSLLIPPMNIYSLPVELTIGSDSDLINKTALMKITKYKTSGNEKNWKEKFRAILKKNKLSSYEDEIMSAVKWRLLIDKLYVGKESPRNIGFSKLGGNPDVPPEFEWPYWKNRPLSFLMQLNLEDLKDFECSKFHSHTGFLYFFYDPLQEDWGIEYPKNKGAWRVIYYAVDKSVLLKTHNPSSNKNYTFPTCYISFYPDIHLPSDSIQLLLFMKGDKFTCNEESIFDGNYSKIRSKILEYNHMFSNHALFGYADMIQEGPFFLNQIHLLQLGDDEQLNWRWGGGGRLHFYIKEEDLKKNDYDDVQIVLDCF